MKGLVFTGDRKTEIREFPIPIPNDKEVRIKSVASSICGSDMMFYKAPSSLLQAGAIGATGAGAKSLSMGTICGHEASGIVDAVGTSVTNVKVGDRVITHHHQGCGHCQHCADGEPMLCKDRQPSGVGIHGSNADYSLIKAENCLILPDELSFEEGTFLGCQAATAYSALRKACVSGDDYPVVVYGLGPLGMLTALMARYMGATVVGIDISDYRTKLCLDKNVVDYALNPLVDDCSDWLTKFTNGLGVQKGIVSCGADQMRRLSAEVAAVKGTIIVIGASEGNMDPNADASWSFDGRHFLRKELTIRGSYVMPIGMYYDLVRFLVKKEVQIGRIITHRFSLEQADEAYELFEKGLTGKVIFNF